MAHGRLYVASMQFWQLVASAVPGMALTTVSTVKWPHNLMTSEACGVVGLVKPGPRAFW